MRKYLLLNKLEVGVSVIPLLVVILLTGLYKMFFTYFLLTFIHELGHSLTAIFFKVKVNKIKLSIFGFNAEIESIDYLPIYKQLLIIIMGPLTYFFSAFLIKQLYIHGVISLVLYHQALMSNLYILLFNLLPIYPLDGGRIIKIVLDKIFTFKMAKIMLYLISFAFIIGFTIYTRECKQYLMYLFLILNFIINILKIKKEWKEFLLRRLWFKNKYKDKLHHHKDLYVYKNNYLISSEGVLNEKEMVKSLLLSNFL